MKAWLNERGGSNDDVVFPNARGSQLSPDGVQYLLAKHVKKARKICPTLKAKRVSPHVLRHTAAMELLQAGVDHSVIALWLGSWRDPHQRQALTAGSSNRSETS